MNTFKPSVVCIGHACHDDTSHGLVPGGTVTYASLMANQLGAQVSVITSTGSDFLFESLFRHAHIKWYNLPSKNTTCFVNTQTPEGRKQKLLNVASFITPDSVKNTPEASIVHLGPIANEIHPDIIRLFPNSLIGLSLQGWLRRWDNQGNVNTQNMDWRELRGIDLVFASEEDLAHDPACIEEIIAQVPALVLTQGRNGATVYRGHEKIFLPSYPVIEKDATGAGDTFAISFLMNFLETNDYFEACCFAHSAASLMVEGRSIPHLPQREDVFNRLHQYKSYFSL